MASAWERRNERARALGYRNWYDYRVHDYGRLPPDWEPLKGEPRQIAAGKRGQDRLMRQIGSGNVEMIALFPTGERDAEGKWTEADLILVMSDGDQKGYRLRGKQLSHDNLQRIKDAIDDAGIFSDVGYLDVFLGDDDLAAAA